MVVEWIFWLFGLVVVLMLLLIAYSFIIENKEARFPNIFTPVFYSLMAIMIIYMLVVYFPN